jgi:hypothetical protein
MMRALNIRHILMQLRCIAEKEHSLALCDDEVLNLLEACRGIFPSVECAARHFLSDQKKIPLKLKVSVIDWDTMQLVSGCMACHPGTYRSTLTFPVKSSKHCICPHPQIQCSKYGLHAAFDPNVRSTGSQTWCPCSAELKGSSWPGGYPVRGRKRTHNGGRLTNRTTLVVAIVQALTCSLHAPSPQPKPLC